MPEQYVYLRGLPDQRDQWLNRRIAALDAAARVATGRQSFELGASEEILAMAEDFERWLSR